MLISGQSPCPPCSCLSCNIVCCFHRWVRKKNACLFPRLINRAVGSGEVKRENAARRASEAADSAAECPAEKASLDELSHV